MTIAAHIAQSVKTTEMTANQVFDALLFANVYEKHVKDHCPHNRTMRFIDGSIIQVMDYAAAFEAGISPRKYAVIAQDKAY